MRGRCAFLLQSPVDLTEFCHRLRKSVRVVILTVREPPHAAAAILQETITTAVVLLEATVREATVSDLPVVATIMTRAVTTAVVLPLVLAWTTTLHLAVRTMTHMTVARRLLEVTMTHTAMVVAMAVPGLRLVVDMVTTSAAHIGRDPLSVPNPAVLWTGLLALKAYSSRTFSSPCAAVLECAAALFSLRLIRCPKILDFTSVTDGYWDHTCFRKSPKVSLMVVPTS